MRSWCQTLGLLDLRRSGCYAKEIPLYWGSLNRVVLAAVAFGLPADVWEIPQYLL